MHQMKHKQKQLETAEINKTEQTYKFLQVLKIYRDENMLQAAL